MPRLYRPAIPVEVKVRVALRQLGEMFPDDAIKAALGKRGRLGGLLEQKLSELAKLLGCEVQDLRLDHDPPLGARPQERRGLGKTRYIPDANDPEHLKYRPHGPQFDGSHLIKTNVRGDHGQHPDRVLIKKQRRIERGPRPKRGPKIRSRGFASKSGAKLRSGKQKWPKRPFRRGDQ